MKDIKDKLMQARLMTAVAVLSAAPVAVALAQGADPLGAQNVANSAIATIKVIAALGVAWGFFRLFTGRHTIEGLVMIAVGALGIGKSTAIAGLLGLT